MLRILLFAIFLFILPQQVTAQVTQDTLANYPMPDIAEISEAEFLDATLFYDEMPLNEKLFSYQIRVPKTWHKWQGGEQSSSEFVPNFLQTIARYNGPLKNGAQARFILSAERIELSTTVPIWFLNHIKANAYTLQGLEMHGNSKLEALYVVVEGGITYVARSLVQLNGDKMIMAEYYIPASHWEEDKDIQLAAIKSFRLNHIEEQQLLGYEGYKVLDIVEFKHPKTWERTILPFVTIDRLGAQLTSSVSGETLAGQIEIRMMSYETATSLAKEIEIYKNQIEERGLIFGDVIEPFTDYKVAEKIKKDMVEVYEISNAAGRSIEYEFVYGILAGPYYYYFVTMLTPGRNARNILWLQNMEVYKAVLESVSPL